MSFNHSPFNKSKAITNENTKLKSTTVYSTKIPDGKINKVQSTNKSISKDKRSISPIDKRKEYSNNLITNKRSISKDTENENEKIKTRSNASNTTSLLMKYHLLKDNKNNQNILTNVSNKLQKTSVNLKSTNINALQSQITPRSSTSKNSQLMSKSKSKDKTKDINPVLSNNIKRNQNNLNLIENSSKERKSSTSIDDIRINKFNKSIKSKDFRLTNTSPLLLSKKVKQSERKSSANKKNDKEEPSMMKEKNLVKTLMENKLNKEKNHINVLTQIKVQKGNSFLNDISDISLDNKLDSLKSENINNNSRNTNNKQNFKSKTIDKVYEISRIGYAPGMKKFNQDNYFIFENFINNPEYLYLAVCDGHGEFGHDVSKFLRETLPSHVNMNWIEKQRFYRRNLSKSEYTKLIETAFETVNQLLICNQTDTSFSGSTCVSLIYTLDNLICANTGDSRCTIGRLLNNKWIHHDLSRDHKPNESDEMERILESGGRVEPYYENGEQAGPFRVWLKDKNCPGLAMSRSFGDEVASSVGVIPIPEIKEWKLTEEDKFVILASDGLWEFMESEEVVNIVKDFYLSKNIQGAAEYLVKESTKRWIKEESTVDDITIIIIFFEEDK